MFQKYGTAFQDVKVWHAAAPAMTKPELSRERIVAAAIELLDEEGERGLTFRALATRLETGAGAIYWHVANKDELLAAATDWIVTRALRALARSPSPREAIRRIALGVFDAVDAHPWIGAQLSRAPWDTATLKIFERIGRELGAVPARRQFTAASALVNYIVGVSVQNAANGRQGVAVDRARMLEAEASRWADLAADEYPFMRSVAAQLRGHDDRAEFLAGVDLILKGTAGISPARRS